MDMNESMVFPNVGMQTLSAVIHFVATAVLAACLARRVAFEDLNTLRGWKHLTVARLSLILIFAISLAFIMVTGTLIHGVGLEYTLTSCSLGIWSCILLYTSTKLLIYIFLSERVWLVWSNVSATKAALNALQTQKRQSQAPNRSIPPSEWRADVAKRLRNPVYVVCLVSLVGYVAVIILLLVSRIAGFRKQDGSCVIGLAPTGSIPLLSYDAYITVLLTALFVWPLRTKQGMSNGLRRLTTRTLIASFAALATSAVNISILAAMKGHQLGWVCLASCGTDVMLNALVLDFVTQSRLKRIANGRADRLRPAGPNVTDSSFPTSGHIASGKVHFTAAPPPRAPRASHLTVGSHYVRPQSVELRSQTDETDIKSPSIYSEAPPTPRYPPLPKSPEPNHEVEDDDDELDVEIDGDTLARNHGLDLERNGSSHRSASSRRPVAAEADSEAYELTERPPTRLQKYQRHSSLAYYNDETEEYDLGFDHMRYTPEPPSPWDPTASFAQGSSSQTVTWAPSVGASGYDDLALSRTVSNPSLAPSPPPSALLSVRGALKGFAALQSAGSSNKSAPMSFPRPMNTVVVVTSASETRVDTE